MQTIMLPVEGVFLGKRQRTDDEGTRKHIEELARDIAENGLIHAPQVDENNNLVAGWCRFNAIKTLGKPYYYAGAEVSAGFIPVTRTHKTDERDLYRIELMENLRRKNLSPMDEAKAVTRLHKYYEESNPTWTKEETGKALDSLRAEPPREVAARTKEVSDALLISQFEGDADVQKAASRREAVAIVRKKMEQNLTAALGEFILPDNEDFNIIQGSCLDVMETFSEGEFSGIVTDPPYGIDADAFGEQAMKGGHNYADTPELALGIAAAIFQRGHYICAPDAHLYMFCDVASFFNLADLARAAGWQVFNTPLIWHKPNIGHAPWPGYFGRRYETILFAQKGARKLQSSRSDIFTFPAETSKVHAAQKPVELLAELLRLSFFPGERILDPCAGSGSIFRAAKVAKMRATGIELDPQSVGFCKNAIQGE